MAAACDFRSEDRVLDLASPKLLSLYLADSLHLQMYATDIDDYFIPTFRELRRLQAVPKESYHLCIEDGRQLSFAPEFFSKVYAISAIEHIPGDGDVECARELGRVLGPGGRCAITVPFSPESQEEYREPDFYYSRFSETRDDGKVFFQRRYSERDLHERIIGPSGLRLRRLQYIGERIQLGRNHELCQFLPWPTGPIQPLLSTLFLSAPSDSWQRLRKPLCAAIVLEK